MKLSLPLRFGSMLAYCLLLLSTTLSAAEPARENWPNWRGPRGDGTSLEANIPTTWNGETGENIAWKVAVPGSGHSSPIVHGDHLFLLSCLPASEEKPVASRVLLAFDRKSGKQHWMTPIVDAELEKKHSLNSFASGTPATDGKAVFLSFLDPDFASDKETTPGEMVVAAVDYGGKILWTKRPGRFSSTHGFCSSPVLFEDLVIINGDHDGDAYIVALNKESGEEVWKTSREHRTRSYVTPIIREIDGQWQMILSGSKCVASYDPATGKQLWQMEGPTEQFVASPVYDGKYVYLTAGFPERHILAIEPRAKGKIGDEKIIWRTTKAAGYVPSPVLAGEFLLVAADNGTASCYAAQSGELQWTERMGKHYSPSLVSASGLAYLLADDGMMKVVKPGPVLDVIAENKLGEYVYSSPAISQGQLFIRGEKHLFAIGTSDK
ncbi:FOG: WD40 repeat-like protein [Pirellula staleyi DSM 6068]|uniref:FOG: WD40 repeat-like protein n=1 Tax=Pirellula staleyi (strain ATCC 27377 / DSM 6068 / ICPB 4128) TaxID=530564 RepID=D2QYB1_PIRSD|nr:PQQ-binding-like beta-propeller repeat protein [Pirellula staleyi]ADB16325.1 FOG: WD40 repeat-like protein [Pirellula staleyi DSM 6068]